MYNLPAYYPEGKIDYEISSSIYNVLNRTNSTIIEYFSMDNIRLGPTYQNKNFIQDVQILQLPSLNLLFEENLGDNFDTLREIRFTYVDDKKCPNYFLIIGSYIKTIEISIKYTNNITLPHKILVHKAVQDFKNYLLTRYPLISGDDTKVLINFSYLDDENSLNIENKEIYCPTYDTIRTNYPTISSHVDHLLSLERPDEQGKFIFWYGLPGTGKSWLIRALAQKFKTKAEIYYIIDPEQFLYKAVYMQKLITHQFNNNYPRKYYIEKSDEEEDTASNDIPIKLFIIEDGLNYIMVDSSYKEGGAVSRILNITDGLLGEGLRLLFLVTSNEKIGNIDPAFLRPGRCLQSLEFSLFNRVQAQHWLTVQKTQCKLPPHKSEFSLAELYSLLHSYQNPVIKSNQISVGFKNE